MKQNSWRDVYKVHPAADALPMLDADALRDLGEDIKKNGLRDPIILWSAFSGEGDPQDHTRRHRRDTTTYVLDGRNRLDAMELVGMPTIEHYTSYKDSTPSYYGLAARIPRKFLAGRHVRLDLGSGKWGESPGTEPVAYVISANLIRRHLRPRDLVMHAIAVRASAVGGRAEPIRGVELRDEDGILRQTRSSVRVSPGGRGHKSEATEIAEQTGVPARTVRRVMATGRPTGPADLREARHTARQEAQRKRRSDIGSRLVDAVMARLDRDPFDTIRTLVTAALDEPGEDRLDWGEQLLKSWASTDTLPAADEA